MARRRRSGNLSAMPGTSVAPVRLLISYDGSESAAAAISAAAHLVPGSHARVVYVRPPPDALEHAALARIAVPDDVLLVSAREYGRQAAERASELAERGREIAERAGLHATAEVRTGSSAWRVLCGAAEEGDVDVLVCGSRGRGPFSRAMLGSTSSSLLHHAACPVLVVPPGAGDLRGPVLVGYDDSDGARAAITAAARIFPGRNALIVHAWSSPIRRSYVGSAPATVPLSEIAGVTPDLGEVIAQQARALAEEGAAHARDQGLLARGIAVEGSLEAWRTLSATGRAEGASVIVTGCRGRGALGSTILGSVSAGLVHNAELPILIVRGHS
jgi:nucleotide-binding universal stress UspA family protein